MFPAAGDACARAGPKRLAVIAECRKRQVPADTLDTPNPDEFGALHYEERAMLVADAGAGAVGSYTLARAAFESSPSVLHASEPKSLYGFRYAAVKRRGGARAGATAAVARRILATFTARDAESSGGSGAVSYWRFRVRSTDGAFWRLAGRLAVVASDTGEDACAGAGGCDLKDCRAKVRDEATNAVVGCEFAVNVKQGASHTLSVLGFSDAPPAEDARIHLEYKPPGACVLKVGCDNPVALEGVCRTYSTEEMEWQSVRRGAMPTFECVGASAAAVASIAVETKPFCIAPSLYQVRRCASLTSR